MPGRQAHGGPAPILVKTKKSKAKFNTKNRSRSLRAYEIATEENPIQLKDRHHRLSEDAAGSKSGKRGRDNEFSDGDKDGGSNPKKPRMNPRNTRFDDAESGSDSEGNQWMIGRVASDDDSDLDSEEAFGESDEEKFEDFSFGGSSTKGKPSKNDRRKAPTLHEDEKDNTSDGNSDGRPEADAIDLAQMLDDYDEDNMSFDGQHHSGSDDEESQDDSGNESSLFSRDSSEEPDAAKLAALGNLIDALPDAINPTRVRKREGANEFKSPSDFGIVSYDKLTLNDLGLPSVQDPHIKRSLKYIESSSKTNKKIGGKLDVPLAKREQDKLDRDAAYLKAKETLDRWTDTVKHNRRAEHLQFPLRDPNAASVFQNTKLLAAPSSKPFNDLEAAIRKINEESGFGTLNGRDEEDTIQEFEELQANKLSLEEVKMRRNQLRANRELMFREEVKAKRIKKIKSKSYRRVHRRQREKEERMNKEALHEAGVETSEDELELQNRRRAAERMGSRHRGSKWAKSTKESGRGAWDEAARSGVADMARRDEELRKRVEGKIGGRNAEISGTTDSESDQDDSSLDDDERMNNRLDRLDAMNSEDKSDSKLLNMKFMKNAAAALKEKNDKAIKQLRREQAGIEIETTDEEINNIGRRTFGPGDNKVKTAYKVTKTNSFEDPGSDDGGEDVTITTQGPRTQSDFLQRKKSSQNRHPEKSSRRAAHNAPDFPSAVAEKDMEGGAWSRQPICTEGPRKSKKGASKPDLEELDLSQAVLMKKSAKADEKKLPAMLAVDDENSDSESEENSGLAFTTRDQELIKRAFAGADVVGEFEREKQQTIQDEEEKVIDNALPGWGSWVYVLFFQAQGCVVFYYLLIFLLLMLISRYFGFPFSGGHKETNFKNSGEGISKKERNKKKGRFLTKVEGIKAADRKDAKLERVIINEKRIKKNTKYLASSLPHPFETREQYERSLRLPVGPEWSTKETFQTSTKPRVILKQGIVAPMAKPLL